MEKPLNGIHCHSEVSLSPNRHDKTPSYTRGRHILLIEKERTSYDTMEMVWQPHPCIE